MCQAQASDQIGKIVASVFTDHRRQVRLAVMEFFGQSGQRQLLVMVLDVLQDDGKIGTDVIVMELHALAVIAQQVGEHQIDPIDAAAVAVVVVAMAFDHGIADKWFQLVVLIGFE